MNGGVKNCREMIRCLKARGGLVTHHGGEVKMKFKGTTVRIGRHDFSRGKQQEVERKLTRAGLRWRDEQNAA